MATLIGLNTIVGQDLSGSFTSKFKKYQKKEVFSGTATQDWNTVAWKGERLHNQIILWSNSDINGLSYSINDLSNGTDIISTGNIELRFGQYIKGDLEARSCGEYPSRPAAVEMIDALDTQPIVDLSASDPIKLWITIDVPASTPIGKYLGTLTVNGGLEPLVFNLSLEVVDYTLPDTSDWDFHLDLWQFPINILDKHNNANPSTPIEIWSGEHFALFEPAYRLLADAGQKAITAHIKEGGLGAPSMIRWIKKTDGSWKYDFTAFEKYVDTLMSWGITGQIDCFSPVGWNEDTIPHWDELSNSMVDLSAPLGSSVYNERWDDFLIAFKTFLDVKGWFDITVLYLDEVEQSKLDAVFDMVANNDSTWKIGIAHTSTLSSANSDKLYDASGILGTSSSQGREGKISTFYTSCTQTRPNSYVTPENSLAEMVWMGWHATSENLDGYLRWAYDNWRLADPFDARDGAHTAGDFAMVYRTTNDAPSRFLPSLRLLMLREGIQDFEKIKILRAELESSADSQDRDRLNAFNTIISQFDQNSGVGAETLVEFGQTAIAELVQGIFSYCQVNGGSNANYYVAELTSTGGVGSLNFSTSVYPNEGYERHTNSKVSVVPGNTFTLNLTNSPGSSCARTSIWIDWNNDSDFEDEGETVFMGGEAASCSNSVTYSMDINVDQNVGQGIKRMRIQVRDANNAMPVACGTNNGTGTTDFDIEVLDVYCTPEGGANEDYFVVGMETLGGVGSNIDFNSTGFPENGYEHHRLTHVSAERGNEFQLVLENSTGARCARTNVWIDWNGDLDFDDTGELVYNGDTFQSCENTIEKSITVQVPPNAILGMTRMRIGMRDAWLAEPEPCVMADFTSTFDFNLEVKKKPSISPMRTSP